MSVVERTRYLVEPGAGELIWDGPIGTASRTASSGHGWLRVAKSCTPGCATTSGSASFTHRKDLVLGW